jgi:hypothetical protein
VIRRRVRHRRHRHLKWILAMSIQKPTFNNGSKSGKSIIVVIRLATCSSAEIVSLINSWEKERTRMPIQRSYTCSWRNSTISNLTRSTSVPTTWTTPRRDSSHERPDTRDFWTNSSLSKRTFRGTQNILKSSTFLPQNRSNSTESPTGSCCKTTITNG